MLLCDQNLLSGRGTGNCRRTGLSNLAAPLRRSSRNTLWVIESSAVPTDCPSCSNCMAVGGPLMNSRDLRFTFLLFPLKNFSVAFAVRGVRGLSEISFTSELRS